MFFLKDFENSFIKHLALKKIIQNNDIFSFADNFILYLEKSRQFSEKSNIFAKFRRIPKDKNNLFFTKNFYTKFQYCSNIHLGGVSELIWWENGNLKYKKSFIS